MELWRFIGTSMRVAAVHEALARANFEHDVAHLSAVTASSYRLVLHQRSFPILDATICHTTPLRVRMRANDWDDIPPAIELLTSDGGSFAGPFPGGIFNASPHPTTGRPFICMRGSREFHTHTSHINEAWAQYRGQDGMDLTGILIQIASAWRGAVR